MDCTGQSSISTLRVRLSRIRYPTISSSAMATAMVSQTGHQRARKKPKIIKSVSATELDDAVAVIIERDGLAAVAVDQPVGILDHFPRRLYGDRQDQSRA